MSSVTSTPAVVTPQRQSKRKRAQVSYHEAFPFDSDIDSAYASESDNDNCDDDWASRKSKRSKKPNKRARREPLAKPFPFLNLPAELRNRIYTFALCSPHDMILTASWTRNRRSITQLPIATWDERVNGADAEELSYDGLRPALLSTCQQIHDEAIHLLYTKPLCFEDTRALFHFLGPLRHETMALLQDITIKTYVPWGRCIKKRMNAPSLTLLRDAKNLKNLRFEQSISGFSDAVGKKAGVLIARQLYRDTAIWLDRVSAEDAVEIFDMQGDFGERILDPSRSYGWKRDVDGLDGRMWRLNYDEKDVEASEAAFREELKSLVKNGGTVRRKGKGKGKGGKS